MNYNVILIGYDKKKKDDSIEIKKISKNISYYSLKYPNSLIDFLRLDIVNFTYEIIKKTDNISHCIFYNFPSFHFFILKKKNKK